MADIEIRALAFWTHVEGRERAAGFVASEDPEDGYVLFEGELGQPRDALYVEVSDEIFGAEGGVDSVTFAPDGFTLVLKASMAAKFGMVHEVKVLVEPKDEDGQHALKVLRELLG